MICIRIFPALIPLQFHFENILGATKTTPLGILNCAYIHIHVYVGRGGEGACGWGEGTVARMCVQLRVNSMDGEGCRTQWVRGWDKFLVYIIILVRVLPSLCQRYALYPSVIQAASSYHLSLHQ